MRALQAGLSLSDLDALDVGAVLDILTEGANDGAEYNRVATQEDMDRL
jgi:hypothetical protein